MIGSDNRVSMAEVVALFRDAMAKNTAVEKGGDEAEIRKVALEQAPRGARQLLEWLEAERGAVLAPLLSLHDVAPAHPPLFSRSRLPAR
jgi:hypothetical protein